MRFFRHIRACNRFDLADHRPFVIDGGIYGWVRSDVARALADYPAILAVTDRAVSFQSQLADFESRTDGLDRVAAGLAERGLVARFRAERYPVVRGWGDAPVCALDRGAVPALGVRAFGLHVNGYVPGPDGPQIWTAVRARDKGVAPGAYDNLVAGGQPIGLSLWENLHKEATEEAGLPAAAIDAARPVSAISYCLATAEGLKPDTMFIYDLPLAADVVPEPHDGEVERFFATGPDWLARTVADTDSFKFNCNLVAIDFLLRHGYLAPHESGYLAVLQGLRYPVGQLFTAAAQQERVPPLPDPELA